MKDKKYNPYNTLKGFITQSYHCQKYRSKDKGEVIEYSKDQYTEWLFKQKNFISLWDQWVYNDYQKAFKPSVDRIDDYKPYTFDNMQLVTYSQNLRKYCDNPVKAHKKVLQYDKNMKFISEYNSLKEAGEKTNSHKNAIGQCCRGKYKTANGFIWRYK